jgi:hypothetical protein
MLSRSDSLFRVKMRARNRGTAPLSMVTVTFLSYPWCLADTETAA